MTRILPLVLIALFGCSSCTATQIKEDVHHGVTVGIDCAKTDLGQIVKDNGLSILGDVVQIVLKGGEGWQAELDHLGALFGDAAEACAVKAVLAMFDSQPSTAFGAGPTPASRARGFLTEKAWVFVPAAQ